jgi:hypothetical protein
MEDNDQSLANAIKEEEAYAMSDGFCVNSYAMATVILEGRSSHNRIILRTIAPGEGTEMSAYQLAGIYISLLFVKKLSDFYAIEQGKIVHRCEGLLALQQADSENLALSCNSGHQEPS